MRSAKDISNIPLGSTPEEVLKRSNELIDEFNFLSKHMSFNNNFSGQIIDNIEFASGETKTIAHNLGIKPKHRLVLNQVGNGVISDIPSGWNNFSIQLKNNGAVAITATIMLVRE